MEKYCKKLREWVMKIVNYDMKGMIPLIRGKNEYHEKQNKCFICDKRFFYDKKSKNYKNYKKVHDFCHYTGKYRGAAHSICNLWYGTTKKIPVVFHNGSEYDWHLIIKELAKESDCGKFKCLAENTEKYISFLVPVKKEYNDGKIEMFKIEFLDSFRFLPISLSNLTDNLSEIYTKKCPHCKKTENPDFEYCFDELINYDKLVYKCGECKMEWEEPLDHKLIENFPAVYEFFILMNIWILGKSLKKLHYHLKKIFIIN